MIHSVIRRLALATSFLAATTLVGCKSAQQRPTDLLPLRLVVTPVGVDARSDASGVDGLEMELESSAVTEALASALRSTNFVDVRCAQPGQVDESNWVEFAEDVGGDVIVKADVTYSPLITSSTNDRFYLNLPLFLLGGPACWFVNDRDYEYEATISLSFWDVAHVDPSNTSLDKQKSTDGLIRDFLERDDATSLDFLDRAGGMGDYALSVVLPAGLVARETEEAADILAELITQRLVDKSCALVSRRQASLLNTSPSVPFDIVEWEVNRVDNAYHLRGWVDTYRLRGKEVLDGDCLVRAGDKEYVVTVLEDERILGTRGELDVSRMQFEAKGIDASVVENAGDRVRLVLAADGFAPRRFTLDLSGKQMHSDYTWASEGTVNCVVDLDAKNQFKPEQ